MSCCAGRTATGGTITLAGTELTGTELVGAAAVGTALAGTTGDGTTRAGATIAGTIHDTCHALRRPPDQAWLPARHWLPALSRQPRTLGRAQAVPARAGPSMEARAAAHAVRMQLHARVSVRPSVRLAGML